MPETQAAAVALKQEALQAAQELVEAFPTDAVTYALLGAAHHNIGNSDEAAKWLQRCLDLDPERADAYGMLAMIASQKGDFEQSVTWCKEALKRDPAMRDVQNRLAQALMDLGETDQLIRIMEQVVKMPPPLSESYYLLGQGYLQSGDYLKAKESFQIVVGMRPDHTQAYFGLFTACTKLRQPEEAEKYGKRFQELEAIDRNAATDRSVDEDTLQGLPMVREMVAKTYAGAGQIYYRHKDFPQAERFWRKSAGLDPNNTVCRAATDDVLPSAETRIAGPGVLRPTRERAAGERPESLLSRPPLGPLAAIRRGGTGLSKSDGAIARATRGVSRWPSYT